MPVNLRLNPDNHEIHIETTKDQEARQSTAGLSFAPVFLPGQPYGPF